jgi:pyruvate formate lyase activating enzyme
LDDGLELSLSEVMDYLTKRKSLLDGVCVSGGEPTIQPNLVDFLKRLKEMGFKVKLDTNGTNPNVLKEILDNKLVDYVAMDIKNNFDNYSDITGVKNLNIENVKESVNLLLQNNVDYEFRTTLVSEYHTEANIQKMSEELKGAKRLYLQRFVDNNNCISSNLHEIDKYTAEGFVSVLTKGVNSVSLRGYV